jgi:DNA-binding NarL/FixJ family response regulator
MLCAEFEFYGYSHNHVGMEEFRYEELVENELIIGSLLAQGYSLRDISEKTGMSKRIVSTHIRNMKVKLQVKDIGEMRKLLLQSQSK